MVVFTIENFFNASFPKLSLSEDIEVILNSLDCLIFSSTLEVTIISLKKDFVGKSNIPLKIISYELHRPQGFRHHPTPSQELHLVRLLRVI